MIIQRTCFALATLVSDGQCDSLCTDTRFSNTTSRQGYQLRAGYRDDVRAFNALSIATERSRVCMLGSMH